jgi:hypothetical protein
MNNKYNLNTKMALSTNETLIANVTDAIITNLTSNEIFANVTATVPAAKESDILVPQSEEDYFFSGLY